MRERDTVHLRSCRVLDGALATELERHGVSIAGLLWSARALFEAPQAILAVHRSYLEAGADVLLTAGYQVSSVGYEAQGLSPQAAAAEAERALRQSVALAIQARDAARAASHLPQVLIAASLGSYGAALANGAEFHGRYGFSSAQQEHAALVRFHSQRISALSSTDADLLAFETLPSLAEARAIAEALSGFPRLGAWLSFTCRDATHVAHGEPLRACARLLDANPQVLGVGVNCTAPALIAPLLGELRAATTKPLLAYPNSGELWDAEQRCWTGTADLEAYSALAREWFDAGAQLVGGCCRTGPAHVRALAQLARH